MNVDSYERAFIFRTTFARQGDPTTPQEDVRPALRLRAAAAAPSNANYKVVVEVDNAPTGATLEVNLGRFQGGVFEVEREQAFPEPRRRRIGFNPHGPGGALLFDATIQDWDLTFDTSHIVGPRVLRARLLSLEGSEIFTVDQPVTLVDRAPAQVRFIDAPRQALRGAPLALQAICFDPGEEIRQVFFFTGKPLDGKIPPNIPTTTATRQENGQTMWSAQLPLGADKTGPTDISVQFVNRAGLSSFATISVNVLDKLPPILGEIRGTVQEGMRLQPNLEVVLRDDKGAAVKDEKGLKKKTTTRADGTFLFENLPPGKYKVFTSKPVSNRKAETTVEVEAGKTAVVTLSLFL